MPRTPTGHGLTWGHQTPGRRRVSCWRGIGAVRADAPGLSAAKEQPVTFANGTANGGHRIGGQALIMAGGVPMAGRVSRLTGSTFPVAQSLIIPSRIGEAPRAGGVIRNLARVHTVGFRSAEQAPDQAGALTAAPLLGRCHCEMYKPGTGHAENPSRRSRNLSRCEEVPTVVTSEHLPTLSTRRSSRDEPRACRGSTAGRQLA